METEGTILRKDGSASRSVPGNTARTIHRSSLVVIGVEIHLPQVLVVGYTTKTREFLSRVTWNELSFMTKGTSRIAVLLFPFWPAQRL